MHTYEIWIRALSRWKVSSIKVKFTCKLLGNFTFIFLGFINSHLRLINRLKNVHRILIYVVIFVRSISWWIYYFITSFMFFYIQLIKSVTKEIYVSWWIDFELFIHWHELNVDNKNTKKTERALFNRHFWLVSKSSDVFFWYSFIKSICDGIIDTLFDDSTKNKKNLNLFVLQNQFVMSCLWVNKSKCHKLPSNNDYISRKLYCLLLQILILINDYCWWTLLELAVQCIAFDRFIKDFWVKLYNTNGQFTQLFL